MLHARSTETHSTLPEFKTVLACTDFTSLGEAAVESAVMLGRGFHAERIHVANIVPLYSERLMEAMAAEAAGEIAIGDRNLAIEMLSSLDLPLSDAAITREVRTGEPSKALALMAGEIGADLIVVGSHGRGMFGRLILGSVAQELVRVAPCPILVLHDDRRRVERFENIVAGVDTSSLAVPVVESALSVARSFGTSLRVVSVLEGEPALTYGVTYGWRTAHQNIVEARRAALAGVVDRIPNRGVRVSNDLVQSEVPWRGLLDDVERSKADLLVIGSNGRNAVGRMLLGSTATKMVEKCEIPLLVVPRPGV
jgi:nucleotide-binding universal stress UspA family protein